MKKKIVISLVTIIIVLLLPGLLTIFTVTDRNETLDNFDYDTQKLIIRVLDEETKEVTKIDFEKYLVGVVAAEMPVSYKLEALKAQAVAARTYAYKKIENAKSDDKKNYDISNNYKTGQAYQNMTQLKEKWDEDNFYDYLKKITKAVDSTKGEIIVYNDEPIEAVFHATSAGKTQSARDLWSVAVPYLESVTSEGDISAPQYIKEVLISESEVKNMFKKVIKDIEFMDTDLLKQIQIIERSKAGYIIKIQVANKIMTGEQFRKILDLRSSNVMMEQNGNNIRFVTKGYGHGVGMSQYGANSMAKQGYKYRDILKHYYNEVQIKKIDHNEYER